MDNTIRFINSDIVPLVNIIRSFQEISGEIKHENRTKTKEYFEKLITSLNVLETLYPECKSIVKSFNDDFNNFNLFKFNSFFFTSNIASNYSTPLNNEYSFFIGVVKSQNSLPPRGNFLECFITYREEPLSNNILYSEYPHPQNICSSSKLVTGSKGILSGNCVVFFPENIFSNINLKKQEYALFFFNKFKKIYKEISIPNTQKIIINWDIDSLYLSDKEFYDARCAWGYLHDYFHHQGPKPFNTNIKLKMNWFVGLLEEVKCDCQVIIECFRNKCIPYNNEIIEFIIFDRMFRYPFQEDNLVNFDSGTGFFLFNFLIENGSITKRGSFYEINKPKLIQNIIKLVEKILNIEKNEDENVIKKQSKLLVCRYIDVKEENNKKIITNVKNYKILLDSKVNIKNYITNYNFSKENLHY